jgi:AcrR family transcriptional regulator
MIRTWRRLPGWAGASGTSWPSASASSRRPGASSRPKVSPRPQPRKEDLLVLVFRDEMIETTRAAFERADRDAPLVDQLLSVFESMIDYHERDVELTRILLREVFFPSVPERVDDIRELMRVIYQHIGERMLERRQAESIREDLDPRATAEVLFSAYLMVLLVWLRGEISRGQFSSRLRTLLNTVFDGLRR